MLMCVCVVNSSSVHLDTLSGCSLLLHVCSLSKLEQGMVQAVRLIEEERMSTGRRDRAGGISSLSSDTSPKLRDIGQCLKDLYRLLHVCKPGHLHKCT